MVGIDPFRQEVEDDPAFRAGVFVNRHSYRIKMRLRLPSVKGDKNSEIRTRISEFENSDCGVYFSRSKFFCRICQSLRPLTFSMALLLIAVSLVFLVGLFTL